MPTENGKGTGRRAMFAIGRAFLPFLLALAGAVAGPAAAQTERLDAARLATLSRDVERAESVRAIKRVQLTWAHYVDQGEWQRAAALFTDQAELAHGDDRFHGRPEILAYFRRVIGKDADGLPARTVHTPFLIAPIVTLSADGNSAQGRWHAFSLRGSFGGEASWQGGIFQNHYVRVGGAWKIDRQIFHPMMLGPYDTGWRPFRAELPMVDYAWQPADVGQSAQLGPGVPATRPATATLATLGGRVQALDDETAVRNLQNAWGYYVDQKMWDDVVELFAPGASVQIAGVGTYRGARGIRRSLERDGPAGLAHGEMNDRVQGDVIVEVAADGRHARARGIELGMIGQDNARAWWTLTRFDNQFVKQGGIWRIERMRRVLSFRTEYGQGWAKDWSLEQGASAGFAPDGPAPADLPRLWPLERPAPAAPDVRGASLAAVEASLHAAAGVDAIENLSGAYGQYLDDSHWDELGSIFAAQGERDSAGGGFIRTPARITSFSRQRYGSYNPRRAGINMHMLTQPVIHVSADGLQGQSRMRLFQTVITAVTPAQGGTPARGGPMIVTGIYENDAVFEDGRWRLKRADIDHLVYAPYATGWTQISEDAGRRTTPPLTSVANEPFDAMNTGDIFPAFPRLPHMWFHYRNPVSGRSPKYLMPKYVLPDP